MLPLNRESEIPLYEQVYNYIKQYIEQGIYTEGQRLTSVRLLAKENGVSKITIEQAYTQLAAEGYIKAHNRAPYEVLAVPLLLAENQSANTKYGVYNQNSSKRSVMPLENVSQEQSVKYNFATGAMDPEGFDYTRWKRIIGHVLRTPDKLMGYGDIRGELCLREAIALYIQEARSVKVSPQMISISSGAQASIEMLASLLLNLHDDNMSKPTIAMQTRHLKGIGSIFEDYGFNVLTTDLEGQDLIQFLQYKKIEIYYCTPSHEDRTGKIMSVAVRHALLTWAYNSQAYIIEDDYDSELRYYGRPMSSLQGLDLYNRVIYMGAPSKVLPPSIRLSYIVLPPILSDALLKRPERFRQSAGVMEQLVWAEYIKSGEWTKQIRRLRKHYQEKSKYMVKLIQNYFGNTVKVFKPEGGVYISLLFNSHVNISRLVELAKVQGCAVKTEDQHILLSFSSIETKNLEQAIQTLAKAWRGYI